MTGSRSRGNPGESRSPIPPEKVRAYRETHYVVECSSPLRLQIDEINEELARLHARYGRDCSAFVTAFNPSGTALDQAANAQRQAELHRELEQAGLPFLPGYGRHPSNGWPAEPSFLVLGIDRDAACALGRRWGQDAIVWIGVDGVPRLVLLRCQQA